MTTAIERAGERFASDATAHTMTVPHDEGPYRHLQFRAPSTSMYWFDLITVPGALIFQGDGDSFVFRRIEDMFAFFRGSAWKGKPNVGYWAEKLTDNRDSVVQYDQELLAENVKRDLAAHYGDETLPAGLEDAVRAELLDKFLGDETYDRKLVDDFMFYADEKDRYAFPRVAPTFQFGETFEWNCRDWNWWFLWACHAILWGIAQYDSRTTVDSKTESGQ